MNYRIDGPEGAPVLVLSNSLGTDLELWVAEHRALGRVVPGAPLRPSRARRLGGVRAGPSASRTSARDVVDLLDELGVERASFCGLSLGGAIGMWLAVDAPSTDRPPRACVHVGEVR